MHNVNQFANLFLLAVAFGLALWVLRHTDRPELAAEGPELEDGDDAGEADATPAALHQHAREHVHCSGCGAYVDRVELDAHACVPAVRQ